MNRRFLFSLLGAVLCGLVAIWITQRIITNAGIASPKNSTQVYVAASNIPSGTTITNQMIKLGKFEKTSIPSGSTSELNQVVGKIAKSEIGANNFLLTQNLAKLGDSLVFSAVSEGKRAMSIRVDDASSIAGFATPGNHVDIVAVLSPGSGSKQVSKVIAQNLRILAINQETDPNNGHAIKSSGTVTLEVTQAQAAILTLAGREGNLHLIGRNPVDREELPPVEVVVKNMVDTPVQEPSLQKYNALPIPSGILPSPPVPKITPIPTVAPTKMATSIKVWKGSVATEVQVTK